jgi:hypothetical protein
MNIPEYIVKNGEVFETLDKILNDRIDMALVINGKKEEFDRSIFENFIKEHKNFDMLCVTKPIQYQELYKEKYNKVMKISIRENIFPSMFYITRRGCANTRQNTYLYMQ